MSTTRGEHNRQVARTWSATIETHRDELRHAILDAAGALVAETGLHALTMAGIAEKAGIGRATLYKYFRDVEAILVAWHAREIASHLASISEARRQAEGPRDQLKAVLERYALIAHETHGHGNVELDAFLHRDEQVAVAERRLRFIFRDALSEAADAGVVRDDVPPDELAWFCLNALRAARGAKSRAAVERLVALTLAGLEPRRG
jgi:AcrR family transcriptional regulator